MKIKVHKLRLAKSIAEKLKNNKSPFGYACLRSEVKLNDTLKPFTDAYDAKLHEFAMLNDDKSYKQDAKGGLVFTKENQDILNEFWKKQNEEEVEYDPYIATSVESVKDDVALLDALNGIIVNVNVEEMYNQSPEIK